MTIAVNLNQKEADMFGRKKVKECEICDKSGIFYYDVMMRLCDYCYLKHLLDKITALKEDNEKLHGLFEKLDDYEDQWHMHEFYREIFPDKKSLTPPKQKEGEPK